MHFEPYDDWTVRTSKSQTENNLYGTLGVGFVYSRKDFSIGLSAYSKLNMYQSMARFSYPGKGKHWMYFNITMNKKYTINSNWRGDVNLVIGGISGININHAFIYKQKLTLGAGVSASGYYGISPYLFAGYKYKNLEFNIAAHVLKPKGEFSIIYKLK